MTTGAEEARISALMDGDEIGTFRKLIRQVPVADPVLRKITRGVLATRPDHPSSRGAARRFVRYGVSPRGLQALLVSAKVRACLDGRFHVSIEDVEPSWLPALRHRIILDVSAGMEGISADDILRETLKTLMAE